MHLGYKVEFLNDATGTLPVFNSAGSVTAGEPHRFILLTQQIFISEVLDLTEWTKRLGLGLRVLSSEACLPRRDQTVREDRHLPGDMTTIAVQPFEGIVQIDERPGLDARSLAQEGRHPDDFRHPGSFSPTRYSFS